MLENLTEELNNVAIIEVFLNHGIVTESAINCVLKDAIETADFNKARDLIIKYRLKLTPELLKHALQNNISQQNLLNIDALLKLRYLANNAELYKINAMICNLLNSEPKLYGNIDVVAVFTENNITSKEILKYYIKNKNNDQAITILQKCNPDIIVNIFRELLQQPGYSQNKQEDMNNYIDLVANSKNQHEFQELKQRFFKVVKETAPKA